MRKVLGIVFAAAFVLGIMIVSSAQADLTKNTNYTLTHDGIFGGQTERAAIEFQTAKGLDPDGQVGMYTKTVLYPLRDTYYNY